MRSAVSTALQWFRSDGLRPRSGTTGRARTVHVRGRILVPVAPRRTALHLSASKTAPLSVRLPRPRTREASRGTRTGARAKPARTSFGIAPGCALSNAIRSSAARAPNLVAATVSVDDGVRCTRVQLTPCGVDFGHTRRRFLLARACALFACPFGHFGRRSAPFGASLLFGRVYYA